jgi:hypothetical protein
VAPATVSAGWLREIRSAIVARVRDRNPMEVADDLGHRFVANFWLADHPPGTSFFASCNQDLRALVVYAKKSRCTNLAACLRSTYL